MNTNSGTAVNRWTDTNGTWDVTKKGDKVSITVVLGILSTVNALTKLKIRILPSWAYPSIPKQYTRTFPDGKVAVFDIQTNGEVYMTPYTTLAPGGYDFYDTFNYFV
jgi:hypothetical protein